MTLTALRTLSFAIVTGTVACALLLSTARLDPQRPPERAQRLAAGHGPGPAAAAPASPLLQRLAAARDFLLAPAALPSR